MPQEYWLVTVIVSHSQIRLCREFRRRRLVARTTMHPLFDALLEVTSDESASLGQVHEVLHAQQFVPQAGE